jgi:DNA repair exonuclease SbcCD nuclease subunit
VKTAHAADVHLGRRQYGYNGRALDASASFNWFLGGATDPSDGSDPADAIIVPGDLFDSRDIRPATLESTEEALEDVSQPVFISPGNYDENMSRRRTQTWLEYLNDHGLITLSPMGRRTLPS